MSQQVVVYDKRGQKEVVYDAAYTDEQAAAVVRRCVRRHGSRNVRPVNAEVRWAGRR